jgi:hypothetical protein
MILIHELFNLTTSRTDRYLCSSVTLYLYISYLSQGQTHFCIWPTDQRLVKAVSFQNFTKSYGFSKDIWIMCTWNIRLFEHKSSSWYQCNSSQYTRIYIFLIFQPAIFVKWKFSVFILEQFIPRLSDFNIKTQKSSYQRYRAWSGWELALIYMLVTKSSIFWLDWHFTARNRNMYGHSNCSTNNIGGAINPIQVLNRCIKRYVL